MIQRKRYIGIGVFVGLLIIELLVAVMVPVTILSDYSILRAVVSCVQEIVPSTARFSVVSRSPEVVDAYLAFSTLLLPLKMALVALVLRDSGGATYAQFVVSPLTLSSVPIGSYVASANQKSRRLTEGKSSLANRITTSLIVIIFCTFLIAMHVYISGWDIYLSVVADQTLRAENRSIAAGGWSMWLSWSVWKSTLTALAGGVILCVLRDYVSFAAQLWKKWAE